jgi:glycosyltransferase involved in cell wall biosynthesis
MKAAIVTPYYKEDQAVLNRCIRSVREQTHKDIKHFLIADGYPQHFDYDIEHVAIPNCGDYGDTPRAIGAAIASSQGYDVIAFLDADNWYEPDHIAEALKYMSADKPIVTTGRNLRRLDGSFLGACPESDGVNFCDTNCYVIHQSVAGVIGNWTFKPKRYGIIGDRIFWHNLPKHFCARSPKHTVNYTTKFAVHYQHFGEKPPRDSIVFVNGADGLPRAEKYYK